MTANLYSAIRDDNSSNIVVSPFSIHTAASMLYHGTKGVTKAQLGEAIGFRGIGAETIKTENKNLLRSYRRRKLELDTKIEIANSLFADDSFPVAEDYQELLRNFYLTKVRTVDFAESQESVDTINSWVKNKTHNLIEDLLSSSSVDENTKMVLLNAIYFKANWLVPFDPLDTTKAQFHKSVNDSVETDFMTIDTELDIGFMDKSNKVSVVAMPYEDDNYQMLLLIPEQDDDIKELEEKIFDADLKNLSEKLINVRTLLTLPKFKVGYETSLKTAFKKMGAHNVFDQNADLSPISNVTGLLVQDILHKAQVEVNEEGSEAAGVTGIFVGIRVSSKPAVINVNRPFMFVIHDKLNNIPLFIGKIGDPSEGNKAKVEPLISIRDGSQEEFAEFGSQQVKEEVSFREVEENIEEEVEMDAEEEAHIKNFGVTTTEGSSLCGNKRNVTESHQSDISFPCEGDGDTEPIRDYKKKHGDGSRFGHNGELADLNPQLKEELNKER
jgi:serpin B